MHLNQIEQTLRGMIVAEEARQRAERPPSLPRRLWRRLSRSVPRADRRSLRERRSDIVVAGLGIALGVGCALFPWYIFLNPEKFGVRAMRFAGNGTQQTAPVMLGSGAERIGAPMTPEAIPPMQLDLFATGTVKPSAEEGGKVPEIVDQPFPGDDVPYAMVYASAGRAMIADDSGLWVVQPGAMLPDNSRVKSIEQRDGRWVLVTSSDRVVPLSAQ